MQANTLFQRKYAALEYRPTPINGSHVWYWSLLPLPNETHALATGNALSKGKASIQARQEARKQGYAITTIRVRHTQFAEAAAQRIRKLVALREAKPKERLAAGTAVRLPDGKILYGPTHSYCWDDAAEAGELDAYLSKPYEQFDNRVEPWEELEKIMAASVDGFTTERGRFVDREEGYRIAQAAGQLAHPEDQKAWLDVDDLLESVREAFDPDDIDPRTYLKKVEMRPCPSCGKTDWQWFNVSLRGLSRPIRVYRCKNCNLHWRPDMNPEPVMGNMGGCWRPEEQGTVGGYVCPECHSLNTTEPDDEGLVDCANCGIWFNPTHPDNRMEALDPDEFDARRYIRSAFDWRSTVLRMGFSPIKDFFRKFIGKYIIVVYPTARQDNSVSLQFFQSTGEAWANIWDDFIAPTMVEQTILSKIKELGITEALDPDDINPSQYLHSTFNWLKTLGERGFALADSGQDSPGFYFKNVGNHQLVVWPNNSHFGAREPLDELTVQVYANDNGRWSLAGSEYIERALLGVRLDQLIAEFSITEALDPDDINFKQQALRIPGFCKKCDSDLDQSGYCVDLTCPFSDWPQQVEEEEIYHTPREELERKYGIVSKPKYRNEALDPDAVDPKAYTLTTPDFRFAKYADWYAVLTDEHALWDNGLGKIGLNKSGKWRVIDATGVPTKIFKGKTYSTAVDVAMALWLETNKRVTETLDPDAVDPHQYLKSTFATKARVDKLMWAMDSVGLRGIGVCRHEDKWRVYGYVYATAQGAKAKINKALNQFGLKPNGPVAWVALTFDDRTAVNRRFEFELPRHALEYNTAAHAAVKPPGSRTFLYA